VVSNRVEGARIVASRTTGSLHIGPLPSPETLEKYGNISPELLNTIIQSFTKQATHRQSIENWLFKGGTVRSILGVVCAFIMGMTAIVGGVYIVLHDYPIAGTIFGGFGIAGIVKSFLDGTSLSGKGEDSDEVESTETLDH
jgi:uncharacterized membrane protein